jgi:hypothetical protein
MPNVIDAASKKIRCLFGRYQALGIYNCGVLHYFSFSGRAFSFDAATAGSGEGWPEPCRRLCLALAYFVEGHPVAKSSRSDNSVIIARFAGETTLSAVTE